MGRGGQPIEVVVAEVLDATAIGQALPTPDAIVGVGRLVDGRAGGAQLVENVRHLTRGIIAVRRLYCLKKIHLACGADGTIALFSW
jgi:hypothetical protein